MLSHRGSSEADFRAWWNTGRGGQGTGVIPSLKVKLRQGPHPLAISHEAKGCTDTGSSLQDDSIGPDVPNASELVQKSQLFLPGNQLAGSDP